MYPTSHDFEATLLHSLSFSDLKGISQRSLPVYSLMLSSSLSASSSSCPSLNGALVAHNKWPIRPEICREPSYRGFKHGCWLPDQEDGMKA
ncbi:hypothetical protein PoB_000919100 [Plakobranchus ocellatus]|uniref:Uncharacterized protein n=1 Tax=Plakobranchus ocellatus TaxID=259542 RepID=A0AAV3Y604_9GAST|nr:hypothetical protein PoB_000919100 [Plakobranchus ocellatus]